MTFKLIRGGCACLGFCGLGVAGAVGLITDYNQALIIIDAKFNLSFSCLHPEFKPRDLHKEP